MHIHSWIAYKQEFGRYVDTGSTAGNTPPGQNFFEVTHEWEYCNMTEAESMFISVLFCPECKETMDLDPPEPYVTTHIYD